MVNNILKIIHKENKLNRLLAATVIMEEKPSVDMVLWRDLVFYSVISFYELNMFCVDVFFLFSICILITVVVNITVCCCWFDLTFIGEYLCHRNVCVSSERNHFRSTEFKNFSFVIPIFIFVFLFLFLKVDFVYNMFYTFYAFIFILFGIVFLYHFITDSNAR